jgi:hypothetical protein
MTPKEWRRDTIPAAPSGEYVLGTENGWGGAVTRENAERMMGGAYDRAFGPLPEIIPPGIAREKKYQPPYDEEESEDP